MTDFVFSFLTLALVLILFWLVARLLFRISRRAYPVSRNIAGSLAGRVGQHSLTRRFQDRFPATSRFLGNRVTLAEFSGLPLTLALAAMAYVVVLISGIAEEVFESQEIKAVDEAVFSLIEPLRNEASLDLFLFITAFGDFETLLAITLVVSAMLAVHGPSRFILPFWIAVLGAQITSWGGKVFFDRERPEFILDITYPTASFPSGHATGAVSVYLLLAYILSRDVQSARMRFESFFWLGALALLIAFSRIFISVHYASDVAAGILLGLFWAMVAVTVAEFLKAAGWHERRAGKNRP